jgi:polar amino acid transport system permease protein
LFDKDTWISLLKGFWINVQVFLWAEVIVLVWAMIVAIVRLLPGRACSPVRWLATVYVDVFRGIPSLLVILLVGIGLPQAGVPVLDDLSDIEMSVLALSLTYGAYVSEVYRAGIESVHWSQTAAARSLGLSYFQTLRHVVVPQALRRIGPPLLNDFIGLQKDTALIGLIGVLDVITRARFANNSAGSLTAYTMAALLFLAVTLPFTRYLDYILRRQKRLLAGTA